MPSIAADYNQIMTDLSNRADQSEIEEHTFQFMVDSEGGRAPGTGATMNALNDMETGFGNGSPFDPAKTMANLDAAARQDGIVPGWNSLPAGGQDPVQQRQQDQQRMTDELNSAVSSTS